MTTTLVSAAPAVSVVMPVRNEEEAIASVLAQSCQELEVLVVDGSSDDATPCIVGEVAARDTRVRLLHNPDRTIPHALNIGLACARGQFLARVDAHARINATYVERGVEELRRRPELAAVGGRRIGVAKTRTGAANAVALSSGTAQGSVDSSGWGCQAA